MQAIKLVVIGDGWVLLSPLFSFLLSLSSFLTSSTFSFSYPPHALSLLARAVGKTCLLVRGLLF
jgi:hypothetical protein